MTPDTQKATLRGLLRRRSLDASIVRADKRYADSTHQFVMSLAQGHKPLGAYPFVGPNGVHNSSVNAWGEGFRDGQAERRPVRRSNRSRAARGLCWFGFSGRIAERG